MMPRRLPATLHARDHLVVDQVLDTLCNLALFFFSRAKFMCTLLPHVAFFCFTRAKLMSALLPQALRVHAASELRGTSQPIHSAGCSFPKSSVAVMIGAVLLAVVAVATRGRGRGRPRRRPRNESVPPPPARRVRTRQSYQASGESLSTPATGTSIRDTAINPSRSTGSQQSQDSDQSMFNINYRHQNRQQLDDDDGEDQALSRNLDESRINPRICICDRQLYPTDCSDCDLASNYTCESHKHVPCSHESCNNRFHCECLRTGRSTDATLEDLIENYVCMECKCSDSAGDEDDLPWSSLSTRATELDRPNVLRERLRRVGIYVPDDVSNEELRLARFDMNKIVKAFENCNSPETVSQHFGATPRQYPTPVDMDPKCIQKHVVYGRRAETSLLMYDVKQCHCCGSVKPGHDDPCFPSQRNAPFDRQHLVNSWHPAYLCTCSEVCRGSQFYAGKRPSLIAHYAETHGGSTPASRLGDCVSDAVICKKCYDEVTSDNRTGEECA